MISQARALEILVAKIQSQLAPNAEVLHDVRLPGRHSRRPRQIDVLMRHRIGQHEFLVVLEAKDLKRPVDVKAVEAFAGLRDDVNAHKGCLVSAKGFSAAAKARAAALNIDLYSPVDSDPHKWTTRVSVPALCDMRCPTFIYRANCDAAEPISLPDNFPRSLIVYNSAGEELGTCEDGVVARWQGGGFPNEPGQHQNLPIFAAQETFIDNGFGIRVPARFTVHLLVERRLYFGAIPLSKVTGFRDAAQGHVITNGFQTSDLNFERVMSEWKVVASVEDAPVRPVITLQVGTSSFPD